VAISTIQLLWDVGVLLAKSKSQFYAIAQACMALSVSAPTVEERDMFLDFACKWQKMASEEDTPLAPLENKDESATC